MQEAAFAQSTAAALRAETLRGASHVQVAAVARRTPQPLQFPLDPERDAIGLGAGDSFLVSHFLSDEEAADAFSALMPCELGGMGEVKWMQMYGKDGGPFARLKSTQADMTSSKLPIYRYPTNNQHACHTEGWSETTGRLKDRVAALMGQPINHCVANLYRNERDFIGAHKDKMLDILSGTAIATLSLGASRPLVLEHEDGEQRQEVPLRPGSVFIIGPQTNLHWTHSIPKQSARCGMRISLTLRQMGTFLNLDEDTIYGQGATWSRDSGLPRTLPPSRLQDKNWPLWTHDLEIQPTLVYPRREPLAADLRAVHSEGGSTFECHVLRCTSADEVRRCQQWLREENPDACHIPCAWRFRRQTGQGSGSVGRQNLPSHGWDNDGEPVMRLRSAAAGELTRGDGTADTARDGLFAALEDALLTDCAAFVVRHWDGQKLGLQRLIQAYKEATTQALEARFAAMTSASQATAASDEGPQVADVSEDEDVAAAAHKLRRKLQKALREIASLEEQQAQGAALKTNQLWKIQKKAAYQEMLAKSSEPRGV